MRQDDVCQVTCVDTAKVKRVQESILKHNTMAVSQLFKALSDDTRVKIVYALSTEEELCVCDVANIIGSSTATASHHLRLLRNMGLAKYRKEGKLVFYSLDDNHVKQLINIAFTHQQEVEVHG